MNCELVSATTEDKTLLHGSFFEALPANAASVESGASNERSQSPAVDAALVVHGLGGNFYSSRLLNTITAHLLPVGISVAMVNTRGHDAVYRTSIGGRIKNQGAAYELVSDSRYDLYAWTEFLVNRGFQRIALVGHSLGAIKSLYAQANLPHPNVHSIVAASATRLSYQRFQQSSDRDRFLSWIKLAEQKIADNKPDFLMDVDYPFPTQITANCYVDKYGPAERYDWNQFLDRVKVPIYFIFGQVELERNTAFQDVQQQVAGWMDRRSDIQMKIIDRADHFYAGRRTQLAETIQQWLCANH